MKGFLFLIFLVLGLTFTMHAQNTSGATAKPKATATKTTPKNVSGQKSPSEKTPEESAKSNVQARKAGTNTSATDVTSGQKGVHMKFDTELIDLGKVKKGEKRSFKYNFVNSGSETIDFQIVSGCDCTKTDWPRSPVKPGQKGVIDVTFDSTEKEKSETVDVDIYLENKDPQTNRSIFKRVKYKFELVN